MKKTGGRKSNTSMYEERFPRIFEMILYDRLSFNEFRKTASEEFGVSTRTADKYWTEAKTRLKEKYQSEVDTILEEHLTRMYDLLRRCRTSGNRRVEREVLSDLSKIYGLESVKKLDITSGGEPINIKINIEE
jgi:hypothetical protein